METISFYSDSFVARKINVEQKVAENWARPKTWPHTVQDQLPIFLSALNAFFCSVLHFCKRGLSLLISGNTKGNTLAYFGGRAMITNDPSVRHLGSKAYRGLGRVKKLIGSLRSTTATVENTSPKKMNLRSFKLHSDYFISLTLSIIGYISWSQILDDRHQVYKEKSCVCVLHKT